MRESLGSESIGTHARRGGRRRDVEDAGVDMDGVRTWRTDLTSGRLHVLSKG